MVGGGWVGIYDVLSAQPVKQFTGFAEGVKAVAFTPDGTRLAVLSAADATVVLIDLATGKLDERLDVKLSGVSPYTPRVIGFSRDGRLLAGAGRTMEVWECGTRSRLQSFAVENAIAAAAFAPDGNSVVIASSDYGDANDGYAGSLSMWEVATGKRTTVLSDAIGYGTPYGFLTFSPDGAVLFASSIFRGGAQNLRLTRRLTGQTAEETASHIKRWQWPNLTKLASLPLHARSFHCSLDPGFSADGKRFYGNAYKEGQASWDLEAARLLPKSNPPPTCYITNEGDDAVIYCGIDYETRKEVQRLHGVGGPSALSEDRRLAATASAEGEVTLWDASTGKVRAVLLGHEFTVHTLQFAAKGTRLFTADDEMTILWDADSGRELRRYITLPRSAVATWRPAGYPRGRPNGQALASADGRHLVTVSQVEVSGKTQYAAAVWEVETGRKKAVPLQIPGGI